jgi:hypothetical protein
MFVYVDDIVIAFHPSNRHLHPEFEKKLDERYSLKCLGDLKWFLGHTRSRHQRTHDSSGTGRLY